MCGIFAVSNHPEAPRLTYLGLYALQHRGEESAGIVCFDGKYPTHIPEHFGKNMLEEGVENAKSKRV